MFVFAGVHPRSLGTKAPETLANLSPKREPDPPLPNIIFQGCIPQLAVKLQGCIPQAWIDLGVSKNRVTPKWMVYTMENPIKMDDLGGKTSILGNIHLNTSQEVTCHWIQLLMPIRIQLFNSQDE